MLKAQKEGKPFFVWFNTTHMHFRTHCKPSSKGQAGKWQSEYVSAHSCMLACWLLRPSDAAPATSPSITNP
jgi:hypothetical protein